MQTIMYAGLRNAARDQAIAEALMFKHAKEVGQEFNLTPNAVRAAAKRITDSKVFDLKLIGGGRQWRLALWEQALFARRRWVFTAPTTAPSAILICPAGRSQTAKTPSV